MGRILFGSEFGANLGHIYPMLRVADVLSAQGHEIIFAARDVTQTYAAVTEKGYKVVPAPYWINPPIPNLRNIATPSYADVLVRQGFGHRGNLAAMFSAWAHLINFLKPDLVIADHSPGMSLAARNVVPMINMGNGFTLPPTDIETYPPIIARGKTLLPQARLLSIINDVLRENGRHILDAVPQIFDTEGQYVCTVPQLDPYAHVSPRLTVGPLEKNMEFMPLPDMPHVFVYMAYEGKTQANLLAALEKTGMSATVFMREAPHAILDRYQSAQIEMLDRPADFAEILPKSSLVIHSGGGGTATACLMTGRPQLTFPTHSETMLNSKLMAAAGVAKAFHSNISPELLITYIEDAVADEAMRTRAVAVAKELSNGDWRSALQKITAHAFELMP